MLIFILFYLLFLFIILFLIYKMYFNKTKNKSLIFKLELATLVLSFFGAIPLIINFNQMIDTVKRNKLIAESYSNIHYANVIYDSIKNVSCIKFTKSEYSPENFDEIQNQYNNICKWSKINKLPKVESNSYISKDILISMPKITDESLKEFTDDFILASKAYNQTLDKIKMHDKENSSSDLLNIFLIPFYPILLALALMLQLIKITYDYVTN